MILFIQNAYSNLRWDANGNLAQQMVYSVANNATTYQGMRYLQWDEDDRLNLVAGDGYLSYYAYGHDGNRAIKMTGNATIDQNGVLQNTTNLENITIYPNEYLTVTQAEYTKYYYAGGNRIASKIGTGGFEKMQRLCTEDLNISGNANTLFGNALQQIVNITNQPNDEFPVNVCGGYSVATELLADPLPNFYINSLNQNFTQNNLLQQFRQNLTGVAEAVYYFHSDHLGSASWITDGTGAAVQHLQYLPFGEHFVNEQSSGYFERFTFTGKERDAETGYYYHGARFNSSDLGWLSVDPMSDKYPSMSPYAYCAWNPVKLVDPTGEEADVVVDNNKKTIHITMNIYYNRNNKDFDSYVANSDMGLDQLERARQKGFSSRSWEHIDSDKNKWMISFNISFIPLESDDEVDEALKDPVANKLMYNKDLDNSTWDPNTRTITLGTGSWLRMAIENDAGTLSHEIGHGLGLQHPKDLHKNEVGNYGIMSYGQTRSVENSEVSSIADRILKSITGRSDKIIRLHLYGSEKRNPKIISQ